MPTGLNNTTYRANPAGYRAPGLRVRFSAIRGATAKGVLTNSLYLPVTLGDFTVSEEFGHQDYDTVSGGEFSVPQAGPVTARRLRTSDLDTLTIDWFQYARWIMNSRDTPEKVRSELYKIARARTPFELVASIGRPVRQVAAGPGGRLQSGLEIDELRMSATIRSISKTLRPGEADTRYMTLGIKEWRDNGIERRRGATVSGSGKLPTKHKLTDEDTLHSLAKLFYDPPVSVVDGAAAIASANGIPGFAVTTKIVHLQKFKVGDFVKIPKPPELISKKNPASDRFLG